jgi:hypothetical protein
MSWVIYVHCPLISLNIFYRCAPEPRVGGAPEGAVLFVVAIAKHWGPLGAKSPAIYRYSNLRILLVISPRKLEDCDCEIGCWFRVRSQRGTAKYLQTHSDSRSVFEHTISPVA